MQVMSVTGPVDASDLGVVLPHEHVFADLVREYRWTGLLNDEHLARQELALLHQAGGRTLVDLTLDEIGRDRMPYTLDPLDVLLSKLQIVRLNEKDVRDIVYLLSGYPVRDGTEAGTISLDLYRPIVGDDWGWWRTVTMNLDKIGALIAEKPEPGATGRDLRPRCPGSCPHGSRGGCSEVPALEAASAARGPGPLVPGAGGKHPRLGV